MRRTGTAELPLHYGRAPKWLVARMVKLANAMVTIIIDEYDQNEFLRRISDPFWFQALGCVLGYDWHSSGVTTVLTGVLKSAVSAEEHGIAVCGGKGRAALKAPNEIRVIGENFGFSSDNIDRLVYSSKMSAKVDNTAVQAGYALYHHAFFVSEKRKWAVVQQGMSARDRTARRYHWLSDHFKEFVVEPHRAIIGDVRRDVALDMTARESEECRKTSVDLVKEDPGKLQNLLQRARPSYQRSLEQWMSSTSGTTCRASFLAMPRNINWSTLRRAYEFQPRNYEELLHIRGIGPATVRGLALISEMIYGQPPSWTDPVKYAFAYGGKDGVPRPVDKGAMDESIEILEDAIQKAPIDGKMKLKALQKLRHFIPGSCS